MDKVNNSPVSTPAILSDIIQARANIKQKYSALKTGRFETEALINNTFSSIIEPLSEIRSNTKKKPFPTAPPSPPPPSSKPDVDSIEDSFSATPQSPPTTYSDLNARFGPWTQSVLDRIYGPTPSEDSGYSTHRESQMGIWYRAFSPIHSPETPMPSQDPFRSLSPTQSEPSSPDMFLETMPRPFVLRVRNDCSRMDPMTGMTYS
ncbi:hypothetical protein ACI65C_010958 [Semiaphis heraclei]